MPIKGLGNYGQMHALGCTHAHKRPGKVLSLHLWLSVSVKSGSKDNSREVKWQADY